MIRYSERIRRHPLIDSMAQRDGAGAEKSRTLRKILHAALSSPPPAPFFAQTCRTLLDNPLSFTPACLTFIITSSDRAVIARTSTPESKC